MRLARMKFKLNRGEKPRSSNCRCSSAGRDAGRRAKGENKIKNRIDDGVMVVASMIMHGRCILLLAVAYYCNSVACSAIIAPN